MRFWTFGRFAFGTSLIAALVAGCDGAAAPSGVGTSAAQHEPSTRSWIDPSASGGDLVYVSDRTSNVNVFSYPGGQQVGTLGGFKGPNGLCSDATGDVWITTTNYSGSGGTIFEYAHGGTNPIATLLNPQNESLSCSVDPTSGNLAVGTDKQNVAVYTNAQGQPTRYSTVGFMASVNMITYDGSGDLYFRNLHGNLSTERAWLPKGGSHVMLFNVKTKGQYGWDGQHLAVHTQTGLTLFKLNGGGGTRVGTVSLNDCGFNEAGFGGQFSIQGSELAAACGYGVNYYSYPSGGNPITTFSTPAFGVTISVGSYRR